MLTCFILFSGATLAVIALAGLAFYLYRQYVAHQEKEHRDFKQALVSRLQKQGSADFDMSSFISECQVANSTASEVAEDIFGQVCQKAVLDGVITKDERGKLDRLANALGLDQTKAHSIEERIKGRRYVSVAESALADGKISESEAATLVQLRKNFGITQNGAFELTSAAVADGYLVLFRSVIADGQITDAEYEELERYRNALGISSERAREILKPEAAQIYLAIFARAIADGVITDLELEQLRRFRNVLGLTQQEALAIEEEQKRQKYAESVQSAVADGRMSETEERDLKRLRQSFGLDVSAGFQLAPDAIKVGYQVLFRSIVSDGQITVAELHELERYRRSLGIPPEKAQAMLRPQAPMIYRTFFGQAAADGTLEQAEGEQLRRLRFLLGLSDREASDIVQSQALDIYRQHYSEIRQDGEVTDTELARLARVQQTLSLSAGAVAEYVADLRKIKELAAWRRGELPSVSTRHLLEGGEICHWVGECTFVWETARTSKYECGDLLVTSNRIIFVGLTKRFEYSPRKIMDIRTYTNGLTVATSVSKGAGNYLTSGAESLAAILVGVVSKHKYLLAAKFSCSQTRHIPDSVKREVWYRDGGCCVRCRSNQYIEFDHIIPFSKGGTNTVRNVQVLCRACNSLKSDRI